MGPVKQAVTKGPRSQNGAGKKSMKAGGDGKGKNAKTPDKKKFQNNVRGMALLHKFGQNLLKNQGICLKIVNAGEIVASDRVLEIGPGTGNITILMLPQCRKLTAVDIDQRMIAELKKRSCAKGYNNLEAKFGDAMKVDLPEFEVLVANMPYQISSPFIFRLVNHLSKHRFKRAVLMFQKEFSERLMARPGDKHYCRLAINVQMFFKVSKVCDVDRKNFNPPPKVDSMVVKLEPRRDTPAIDYRQWDALLRILFSRKNRELRASLSGKHVADTLIKLNPQLFNNTDLMQCTTEQRAAIMKEYRDWIGSVLDETEAQIAAYKGEDMVEGDKTKGGSFKEKRARLCNRIELMALFTNFCVKGLKFCPTVVSEKKTLPDLFGEDVDMAED